MNLCKIYVIVLGVFLVNTSIARSPIVAGRSIYSFQTADPFQLNIDGTDTITSGNPIIKHIRSADPSAEVWKDGKVWIYCSHDPDNAIDYSTMNDYHVFSSYDMINWTDHGVILSAEDVEWGNPNGGFMFAPDAAYKNGTYYLYFPTMSSEWKWRVGVATSDRPEGPFTDIGHFIEGTDEIDPTCFLDDDGQAYLMWGGGGNTPKIAKLKENMTELAEEPRLIDYGFDNFGEGGYMHKRGNTYYFSYTCNTCWPIQGYYAMGDNPYGPFKYKGELNRIPPGAQDHHSIIEFHHQWYYFYHVGNFGADGSAYRRNVCVDSLFYNEDGSMKLVRQTTEGVGADKIGSRPGILTPGRIEAENYYTQNGVKTISLGDTANLISQIDDNDWFDFVLNILGSEEYKMKIKVSNPVTGTRIYFLVDELLIDSLDVAGSTDTLNTSLFLNEGKHTFRLVFSNPISENNLLDIDWIDLYGEKDYIQISASSSEGGTIYPDGDIYFATGDTAIFRFESNLNFVLESLLIDGVSQAVSSTYIFYNLSENHSIEANFLPCNTTILTPFYQIDEKEAVTGSEITVTEGDDLKLMIDFDHSAELTWNGPAGVNGQGSEFVLDSIQISQEGTYTAQLINEIGCVSEVEFKVSVEYKVLDVYEAEDYFSQQGTQSQPCTDIGGGRNLGFIENNDWSYYNVEVDTAGYYLLVARVATATEGGTIEISIRDSIMAVIKVSSEYSDDWQDWYTSSPVELKLEEGIQKVKFTFKGGGGYLFNFNWFDLSFEHADTSVSDTISNNITITGPGEEFYTYTYPNGLIGIKYSLSERAKVSLNILSLSGSVIRNLIAPQYQVANKYQLTWNGTGDNGSNVSEGIYLLILVINNKRFVQKVVYMN